MANINGTNKNDHIDGTAAADVIDGRRGNDFIDGGAGDDILTGGQGSDTFNLDAGDGDDFVTDFDFAEGDIVMFDSGTGVYDGILAPLGYLYDGQTFSNSQNTATFEVHAVDINGDGIGDTQLVMNSPSGTDSIYLLGVDPGDLTSAAIYGG